jgi:hypothetical protein
MDRVPARSLPTNSRRNIYILATGIFDPVMIYEVLEAFKSSQVVYVVSEVGVDCQEKQSPPD